VKLPQDRSEAAVEGREPRELGTVDGQDRAHQQLLDVLRALRRAVDHEHRERRRDGIDDADDRFLRHARLARARPREERGAADRERERVVVGAFARGRVPRKDRDREPECGHLGEREVDEDHAPREHVKPQVNVDRREHEAREEREEEDLDHRQRAVMTSTKRFTSWSRSAM
jgi:hypothetical protein